MDRVVQASLVLVLEPIFEADFKPAPTRFWEWLTSGSPRSGCGTVASWRRAG
jgi:hypothetical protein